MNATAVFNKLTAFASTSSDTLKRIWHPLWKALSFSLADDGIYPAKNISASLERGVLSVVYGSRFLSRTKIKGVRDYSFEETRYPQPDVFASSLSLALNDLGAAKADITLSIPKAWAIIKTAEFPSTVKENLSGVISYELDRLTPFNPEDAFYDFKILGENAEKLNISIAAAKADLVRPYIEALNEKGITVSRLTINLSCVDTLLRHAGEKADSVFLEMRPDGYEGAFFLHGSITGSFSGNFTNENEELKIDKIMKDIASNGEILKKYGKPPQVTILLKDKSPALKEMLRAQTQLPVRILNETDIKLRLPDIHKEIPYTALGGVLEALWPKANSLNLMSRGVHEKSKSPKIFTVILLLSILAVWILYFIAPLRVEERRLGEIDRQIMLRKDEVGKVEALKKEIGALDKEISTIDGFKGNKQMALNILKELTTILPKNTWLSRVRITETTVELEGYSSSATGILSKLVASKYFKKVEFASPTFRDAKMNADRFSIKTEIAGVKKEGVKKKEGTEEGEEE